MLGFDIRIDLFSTSTWGVFLRRFLSCFFVFVLVCVLNKLSSN